MNTSEFKYVVLNQHSGITNKVLMDFDCGHADITEYLHKSAPRDMITGDGVTYVLVDESRSRIYAYATLRCFGMYKAANTDSVFSVVPSIEIKMFAVSRRLKHVIAYDQPNQPHYATIFFKMLLEELYFMSMTVVGFKMIFLRANDEGEHLYRRCGFIDNEEYLETYDEMAKECVPLMLSLTKLEEVLYE